MKKLIIFGNGEIADLASYYFKSEQDINTEAYIIDGKNLKEDKFNNIPVISLEEIKQNFSNELYDVHIAISYNKLNQNREKKFNEIKKMNYNFRSFVSKKSFISSKAKLIGRNLFILENQVIQNNVERIEIDYECCICLEDLETNLHKTKCCSKYIHTKCLVDYIMFKVNNRKKVTCPYCRQDI